MKTKIFILILTFCLTSCATISYTPKVSLDTSINTIKKTVKVENFIDNVPIVQRKKPFGGYSVTDSESLAGSLSTEVTNAIVEDFNTNGLFSKVSKREENPDFVIKGEIVNFKGKYHPSNAFWFTLPIDIIWLFGIPVMKDDIDIHIKLSIYKNSGKLVGEYYGKSSNSKLYNMYNQGLLGLPTKTNKVFSEAVRQIREKIIEDISKFND
jgi:hypothetical protein